MMGRKAVKAEAKGILGRARMSPYVTTLLVLGTGFLLSRLTDWVQGGSPLYSYELQARYYDALTGGIPRRWRGCCTPSRRIRGRASSARFWCPW